MSDPRLGQFLGQYFVAAYQQVGDFEVINVNGQVQKNGGNVASYFCTPEGRVIHFVLGPVSAETLLAEARWALDAFQRVQIMAGDHVLRQAWLLQQAHRQQLEHGPGNPAHDLLAEMPLPFVAEIYEKAFGELLGQHVSQAGPNIVEASHALRKAQGQGQPILFVLYRDERDLEPLRRSVLGSRGVAKPLGRYVVITAPLEQLPAMANMLALPAYEFPGSESPLIVLADSQAQQIDALSGSVGAEELASRLWNGLAQSHFRLAQSYEQQGRDREALRRLRLVVKSPASAELRDRASQHIARLRAGIPRQWDGWIQR